MAGRERDEPRRTERVNSDTAIAHAVHSRRFRTILIIEPPVVVQRAKVTTRCATASAASAAAAHYQSCARIGKSPWTSSNGQGLSCRTSTAIAVAKSCRERKWSLCGVKGTTERQDLSDIKECARVAPRLNQKRLTDGTAAIYGGYGTSGSDYYSL